MFTGIITDIGNVVDLSKNGDTRMAIRTAFDTSTIEFGASIACSGVCLTVVDKGENWFSVDVSAETLSCTVLDDWTVGTRVNLERALKVGEELGGHTATLAGVELSAACTSASGLRLPKLGEEV